MSAIGEPWIEHYRANNIALHETDYGYGPVFILGDDSLLIKISLSRHKNEEQRLNVTIALEWSDQRPGELADYTLQPEHKCLDCAPGELTISEGGLLQLMSRQATAADIVYHWGWTLQLPNEYVEPARMAIELATAALSKAEN